MVGDERDLIRQRTNARGEQVYLYRLKTPVEMVRAVLLYYLEEINRLVDKPRWCNALTSNCTTTIKYHVDQVAAGNPWDWRIAVNGYINEMGYERGSIDQSLPFAELRRLGNFTKRARAADQARDFSVLIREGLPNPRVH